MDATKSFRIIIDVGYRHVLCWTNFIQYWLKIGSQDDSCSLYKRMLILSQVMGNCNLLMLIRQPFFSL